MAITALRGSVFDMIGSLLVSGSSDQLQCDYFFLSASCAASVMRSATFSGSCNMATWQVGSETDFPSAFSAPARSIAGARVRSLVAITCHEGFDFQAACVTFSSSMGA